MSELDKLRDALNFLTQHLPGASELKEIADQGSVVLDTCRKSDVDTELTGKETVSYNAENFQTALDNFRKRNFCRLEIGRLYERYIGYLYEEDGWRVAFTGVLGGYEDLGRDLVCIRGNEHQIIQAKCWSQKKQIHEKHVYQLFATVTHYRFQLREALVLKHGRKKAKEIMKTIKISGHLFSTTGLSEVATKVAKHCSITFRHVPLSKDYPMVKCNITRHTGEKLYHLPFDKQYDSIIIGNVDGERYVNSVAEAEEIGFRRVGYAN